MRYLEEDQVSHHGHFGLMTEVVDVHELTFVKPTPTLLPNNSLQTRSHTLRLALIAISNVHSAFDRDVRVCYARREQFSYCSQKESVHRLDLSPLLQQILQLLKDGILQYRVDDQH